MEKSLWEAADQFRANSGLKAQEYSGPILGLIFLRFADARFKQQWQTLKAADGSEGAAAARRIQTPTKARGCSTCPPVPATRSCWSCLKVPILAPG